jgi:hypothetical protein
LNVGLDGLKLRIIRAKQPVSSIRMPRRDPNGKVAGAQMPNDAAAKKPVPPNTVTVRAFVTTSSQVRRFMSEPLTACERRTGAIDQLIDRTP